MSSAVIVDGNGNRSKKRKEKYASPFRIKVGCLVALRYRSRGNKVSILMPVSSTSSGFDGAEKESCNPYQEEVASAHFSEVWTDPRWGRDSGLALIGSRIRCFFPKAILAQPYNAGSRLLEGVIVNIVRDCANQFAPQQQSVSDSSSFLVDLLIDNKNNKTLSISFPFLKRVGIDGQSDPAGKILKESEQRRRQYEERIKGGKHKAVVRVSLSKSSFCHAGRLGQNPLEAKWVIRKRVPTKIFRRKSIPVTTEAFTASVDGKGKEKVKQNITNIIDNTDAIQPEEDGQKQIYDSSETYERNGEKMAAIISPASQSLPDSTAERKQQKREPNRSTSFNKDFSLPRYLGDGNDSTAQQEGSWRWEVGRYHNPYSLALSDRPISQNLLGKLSYNFVGEVVSIHPTQTQQAKDSLVNTLAMVTMRLLVLPEHTHSGRLAHHGPFDIFECEDLDSNMMLFEREQKDYNLRHSEKQRRVAEEGANNRNELEPRYLLRVPIEELVIVERNVNREPSDPKKKQKNDMGQKEMTIQHSYSFLDDAYRRCQEEIRVPENFVDKVVRKNTDLIVRLADEVLESESKLGSTLDKLEDYAKDSDSGFIATRFILKGMNQVDFSISPYSLASFINSSSSKPVTKIKARISRGAKKANGNKRVWTSNNMDGPKKNGIKSPARNGGSSRDHGVFSRIISRNEPFRSTSSRLLPYDILNRKFDISAAELYQWKIFRSSISTFPEKPRNLRQHRKLENGGVGENYDKKKLQGRAARAKQRRLLRGVSALGVDVDILAGRETNVRFERSNIHGWGVFLDIDIRQGEMIIEYRGELIGNAMAEKREKEYEASKIGSDYMFRIDEYTVCDASKQGNVARFINASCTPNCHPKIISLDGTKRVVLYAKRDIRAGEELSYDYKFDLEYDPAKRIPCICGSPDCRGFLNWDQRYVALPSGIAAADSDATKKS